MGFQAQDVLDGRETDQRAEVLHEDHTWAFGGEGGWGGELISHERSKSKKNVSHIPHAFKELHNDLKGQRGGDCERRLIRGCEKGF